MILKDGESPKTPFLGLLFPKTVKRILLVKMLIAKDKKKKKKTFNP